MGKNIKNIKNIFNMLYGLIFMVLFFFISYHISNNYLIDKTKIFDMNLGELSKIYIIKQNQFKIITDNKKSNIILNDSNKKITIDSGFNISDVRYIKLGDKKQPIVSVNISSNQTNDYNNRIDKLLDLDLLVRSDNIILAHSSGKLLNLGKYFDKYKKGSIVTMYNIYGDKKEYIVEKKLIMNKNDYIKNFKFYKNKVYMVTCYPIGDNKKRLILVLNTK